MIKKYFTEIVLAITVAFMATRPPSYSVVAFALALLAIGALRILEHRESPDLEKLRKEFAEVKTKVDQLVLRGNR